MDFRINGNKKNKDKKADMNLSCEAQACQLFLFRDFSNMIILFQENF